MRRTMVDNLPRRGCLRFSLVVAAASFGAALTLVQTNARATEAQETHCDGPIIDHDFPSGNIVLERIEGGDIYLHQDNRDSSNWFYWYFPDPWR